MKFIETKAQLIPLDILDLNPGLIKIDVEGLDHLVLKGLRETTVRARPLFLIEYTPSTIVQIMEFFEDKEYKSYVYDHGTNSFYVYDPEKEEATWKQQGLQVNLFFIPAEKSKGLKTQTRQ